jgi:serine/threonine protein kinase/tetratricopeptide (TPR) repeat protein
MAPGHDHTHDQEHGADHAGHADHADHGDDAGHADRGDDASSDHETIELVFGDAVAAAPQDRARLLNERCAGNPRLRAEIESLLAAHARVGPLDAALSAFVSSSVSLSSSSSAVAPFGPPIDRLGARAVDRGDGDDDAAADAFDHDYARERTRLGTTIGPFRLVDEIGRGGMGVVYRAERAADQFTQRVAIKLIDNGPWGADALRRYRAERQILAALNHPHIVSLVDAGLTADGQAYLVMEYVEGVPITSFCRDTARTLADRLRVFQDLCAAVHYAHTHSVVHRDLKPANILVTADGVVKVLDFGVAKLLDDGAAAAAGVSAGAGVAGAARAAAVAGAGGSAGSGVAAAGSRPEAGAGDGAGARASVGAGAGGAAAAADALNRTVTGILRPLTPNYASPEQLRGLPVTTACDVYALGVLLYEIVTGARPYETGGQTLDRIIALVVDREPARPSAAVSVSATPPAAMPAARRALAGDIDAIVLKAMSKDPAARYASAQSLADDIARHLAGKPIVAREPSFGYIAMKLARRHKVAFVSAALGVLALAVAFGISVYETRLAIAARNRADARFADVRQLANALIFKIHDDVRALPGSTPVRKAIVAEALTYLERLSRDPAVDDGLRLELAKAYHKVGDVQGSPATPNLGDREGARQSFRKAIDLLRPLAAGPHGQRDAAIELGHVQLLLANASRAAGDRDDAAAIAREVADLARTLLQRDAADVEARRLLGSALFNQAIGVNGAASLPLWTQAGEVFTALLAAQPDDSDSLRNVALVEKYIGNVYETREDWAAALAHHTRAQTLDQRRLDRSPENRTAQLDVALDLGNVARARWHTGDPIQAAAGYERSLAMRQQLADSDPKDVYAQARVAFVHDKLALLYGELGRVPEQLTHAREAVRLQEPLASLDMDNRWLLAGYFDGLGAAQRRTGDSRAACQTWRRALTLLAEHPDASGPEGTTVPAKARDMIARINEDLRTCGAPTPALAAPLAAADSPQTSSRAAATAHHGS